MSAMGKGLNFKFKGIYQNDNIPYFGLAIAYVDTTGQSANQSLAWIGNPVGARILGTGSFTDGTTEIVSASPSKWVAPNTVLTILYPKYQCMPALSQRFTANSRNHAVWGIDFNDLEYLEATLFGVEIIRFEDNSHPCKGDISILLDKLTSLKYITQNAGQTGYADITGDISTCLRSNAGLIQLKLNNTSVSGTVDHCLDGLTKLADILLEGTIVTGDRGNMIRNMIQANKEAFKARTDTMEVTGINSTVTDSLLNFSLRVIYQFSGTSSVTVKKGSDSSVIGTYDIDTDTFTPGS